MATRTKRKTKKKSRRRTPSPGRKYVIKNKFYGAKLVGTEIYYKGFRRKPTLLKDKGQGFSGGKHLLEVLGANFSNFRLILTPKTNSIAKVGKRADVSISEQTLKRFNTVVREEGRELKLDAWKSVLASTFPSDFLAVAQVTSFRRGSLASMLTENLDPRALSMEDTRALTKFATRVVSDPRTMGVDESAMISSKHNVQLIHLGRLIAEYEARLGKNHSENDWQKYFEEKILHFQDNYIREGVRFFVYGRAKCRSVFSAEYAL